MIAITNRHYCIDQYGDKWEEAFLARLSYLVSLESGKKPDMLVLREKDMEEEDYLKLASKVKEICEDGQVPFVIHKFDRVAEKLGVSRVQLPFSVLGKLSADTSVHTQSKDFSAGISAPAHSPDFSADISVQTHSPDFSDDISVQTHSPDFSAGISAPARSTDFSFGTSVHSLADALAAEKAGASWLFAGNIYETNCKPGLEGRGLEFLASVCQAVSIPVYAIGGINEERLPEVLKVGAAGGCMMSGFMLGKR